MTTKMNFDLSDGLFELRRNFVDFDTAGVAMDPEAVRDLLHQLKELGIMARDLENEVSRHRWNEAARRERQGNNVDALLDEIRRPGTNVALFPVAPRPISDGHSPAGGAA